MTRNYAGVGSREVTPRVWADFNKTGGGRLELTLPGTLRDLEKQRIELRDGLRLIFWDHDADADGTPLELEADATVYFDHERDCWAARYDFDAVRWVERDPTRS
jgi:hypothetical protein